MEEEDNTDRLVKWCCSAEKYKQAITITITKQSTAAAAATDSKRAPPGPTIPPLLLHIVLLAKTATASDKVTIKVSKGTMKKREKGKRVTKWRRMKVIGHKGKLQEKGTGFWC